MDKLIRSTDIYPDWHFQSPRLLKKEIENPMGVLHEFFWSYQLPEARKHFKEMLEDAMCNVEAYTINYRTFYNYVEKLIEAAFLIWQGSRAIPLRACIRPLGREVKDHSLTTLYRHLRRLHNPELSRLFSVTTDEAREQIRLPESAYLKSRYTTTVHPNSEQVTGILQWTPDLLNACNEAPGLLLSDNLSHHKPQNGKIL